MLEFPTAFAALGLLVALIGAGALVQRHRPLAVSLFLAGYVLLVAALIRIDPTFTVPDAFVFVFVFGALLAALWILGSWLRAQSAMRVICPAPQRRSVLFTPTNG